MGDSFAMGQVMANISVLDLPRTHNKSTCLPCYLCSLWQRQKKDANASAS
jgi:hypothetical protein